MTRTAPYIGTDGMQPVAGDLDVELGYAYDSRAICGGGPPAHEDPRQSRGRPGTRAPHVWIEQGGRRISTLDLYEPRFTLIAARDGAQWCAAASEAAARAGLRLASYRADADFDDPDRALPDAYGIGTSGAALIRPDGFVGWRSSETAGNEAGQAIDTIAAALRAMTGR